MKRKNLDTLREKKGLGGLREEMEKVDRRIVKLADRRLQIAEHVAKVKSEKNMEIEDKEREKEVIENVVENTKTIAIEEEYIRDLFQKLIEISKEHQKKSNYK